MKYFIDTEFLEGSQKNLFGNTKPTIDLISIGIVDENGREFYAISNEFNLKEAWNRYEIKKDFGKPQCLGYMKVYWIRDNVLKPIWHELEYREYRENPNEIKQEFFNIFDKLSIEKEKLDVFVSAMLPIGFEKFSYERLKELIKKYGKSNAVIADDITHYVWTMAQIDHPFHISNWSEVKHLFPIEFYAYFSHYDWVVFCWLFGNMSNLPVGFPMYCHDIKQMLDETLTDIEVGFQKNAGLENKIEWIKQLPDYPKHINEHHALYDAKWDKELYLFLKKLSKEYSVYKK